MAQIREIKKRMIAVGSIARITKTMQMIANAKFAAAMVRAKATKPFTEKVRQLVSEVAAAAGDVHHPLINGPAESPKRELLLVISSERGLCGAYNGHVFRTAGAGIKDIRAAGREFSIEIAGKKAVAFCKFRQIPVAERHTFGDKPKYEDVERVATRIMEEFTVGKYDSVKVAYMKFISNARQKPELMQLLPLKASAATAADAATEAPKSAKANYEFSPSSEALLADLLPIAVKATLFQAINEAIVSEQIMRMVAMKSATENAKDLGKNLKRSYNRARQGKITTELTEIVSGAAALD